MTILLLCLSIHILYTLVQQPLTCHTLDLFHSVSLL